LASIYRDLLKHGGVYGAGQILSRIISVLMLPVYARCLAPADYGCIALLDLTVGLLGILIGSGLTSAVNRYHFEAADERKRDEVWWTGLAFVIGMSSAVVLPLWMVRGELARLTLGSSETRGAFYYALALPHLWFASVSQLPRVYLQVRKWSGLFLILSLARLLFNIGLNIYFLVVLQMGVAGVLLGNLISVAAWAVTLVAILLASRPQVRLNWSLLAPMLWFGAPLLVDAFLTMIMHQADRYFLRVYCPLAAVGIYSLAYGIGQGINTLFLMPFNQIWSVLVYEIAHRRNARQIYVQVYEYSMDFLLLIMLGFSLFARPIVALLASPEYADAAPLIPIVCLAYLFFSMQYHFSVPALLSKRTAHLLPGSIAAAVVNLVGNAVLVPVAGTYAAAWVTVATFATYSLVALWYCRAIERYDYPFRQSALKLGGTVACYLVWQGLDTSLGDGIGCYFLAAGLWIAWGAVLFGKPAAQFLGRAHSAQPAMAPAPLEACQESEQPSQVGLETR
jgi:O-antigen/teichoic acid export membrane protein